ncbi:MAG: hypothetical protein HY074_16795 [Deltaproteobacteria bacterium]|nr:hypothetical protein [Deltaproteobacteria bacterium]
MNNLRNASSGGLALLFFICTMTQSLGLEEASLLTSKDIAHEIRDRRDGPALSSAVDDPNPWETYNQWMCFETKAARIESVGVRTSGDWKPWPQISITTSEQTFVFSPSTDREVDTDLILESWKNLFDRSERVCLYAAYLQNLDPVDSVNPEALWILEDMKTETGYWHSEEVTSDQTSLSQDDESEKPEVD